jgi:hypothetical protein
MDIVKAMSSRAQRSRKQSAVTCEAEPARGRAGGSRRRGRFVAKALLLGGVVALATKPEVRNRLLDALFGPEEQFDYESLTEPVAPPIAADRSAFGGIEETDGVQSGVSPTQDFSDRGDEAPPAADAEADEGPTSESPAPINERTPGAGVASAPAEYELWLAPKEDGDGGVVEEAEEAPVAEAPESSAQVEAGERREDGPDQPAIGEADSPRNGWWVPRHRRAESTPEAPGRE